MSLTLYIRADAAPRVGTGHVMRCLALARWALQEGADVVFSGRVNVPWVRERLEREGIPFFPVHGDIPTSEDPRSLRPVLDSLPKGGWLVFDGYHFGLDCQNAARAAGARLMVIDDYAHLPEYDCDILLSQNLGAEKLSYAGNIGRTLLGPRYALLRPEFAAARPAAESRKMPLSPRKLLLTLGGGDFTDHLTRIAPCFSLPELKGITLRVISGAMRKEDVLACLNDCSATIDVLERVEDMPGLLLDTDLCITAGGSTCWELCCLGVPFLTVAVAENQRAIVSEFSERFGMRQLSPLSLASALSQDAEAGDARRRSLLSLVSGDGALIVLRRLAVPAFTLRLALKEDSDRILQLANDPAVRNVSFFFRLITEAEHEAWFSKRLTGSLPFYLAFRDADFVGYARFDKDTDVLGGAVISVAVTPEYRNKGMGTELIKQSCAEAFSSGITVVVAYVKPQNHASARAFISAGFIGKGEGFVNGCLCLRFELRAL